jgi:hypothetical protein
VSTAGRRAGAQPADGTGGGEPLKPAITARILPPTAPNEASPSPSGGAPDAVRTPNL